MKKKGTINIDAAYLNIFRMTEYQKIEKKKI